MGAGASGRGAPSRTSLGVNNSLYAPHGKPSFAANPLYRSKSSSAYEHAVEEESPYSQAPIYDDFGSLRLNNFDAWSGESVVETTLDCGEGAHGRFFQSSRSRTSLADCDGLYEPLSGVPSSEPNAGHDDSDDHYQHIRLAPSETGFSGHTLPGSYPAAVEHFGFYDQDPAGSGANHSQYLTVSPNEDAPQNPNGYMTVAPNKDDVYITPVIPQNSNGTRLLNEGAYMTAGPAVVSLESKEAPVTAFERGPSQAEDDNSEGTKPSESQSRASLASGYIMVEPSA